MLYYYYNSKPVQIGFLLQSKTRKTAVGIIIIILVENSLLSFYNAGEGCCYVGSDFVGLFLLLKSIHSLFFLIRESCSDFLSFPFLERKKRSVVRIFPK